MKILKFLLLIVIIALILPLYPALPTRVSANPGIGDTGAVIDSLEFDTDITEHATLTHISGTVYAVTYKGPGEDGWLKTLNIPDNGSSPTIIDSLEYDTDMGTNPNLIHISGTVYAVVYSGPFVDGWLKTLNIPNDGNNPTVIDSLEWDVVRGSDSHIIHVSGTVYAVSYDMDTSGWVKTLNIPDNGNNPTVIDNLQFDAGRGMDPSLIPISGTVYALAYLGVDFDGWIKTLNIPDNGNNPTVIDSLEFDTDQAMNTCLIHVSGTVYAVVYDGPGSHGWLKTLNIPDNGNNPTVIDSLEFDASYGVAPKIISILDTVYVTAYSGPGSDGWVKTLNIPNDGNNPTVIDNLEFETLDCYDPDIIHISGDVYAVAYRGPDIDGWLKTFDIESSEPPPPTGGMEQVLFGGLGVALDDTATEYNGIAGGYTWVATESDRQQVISTPGKLKKLRIELDDSPGAGKSYAFTLRVGGVSKALTCTIADAAVSAEDSVNEVVVSAGNLVSLQCAPTGTPTARKARWSMVFEGDNAKESLILGIFTAKSSDTGYAPVSSSEPFGATSVGEELVYQICPTAGKIKNFYVDLDIDPGNAPDAYTFALRVNGATSDLTVTVVANNKTGNDTAHEVTVAAGNRLSLISIPISSPAAAPVVRTGMTFVADTDGESIILGGSHPDLDNTDTEYTQLAASSPGLGWGAAESTYIQLGQACTLKNLYVRLENAPGSGKSFTFTVRDTGADGALTVTISSLDVTGNDTNPAHEMEIHDGDEVALKVVPSGTPTVGNSYWGLVSYITPSAPPVTYIPRHSGSVGSPIMF